MCSGLSLSPSARCVWACAELSEDRSGGSIVGAEGVRCPDRRAVIADRGPDRQSLNDASPDRPLAADCVTPKANINMLIDMEGTGPQDPGGDPVACYGDAPLTFDATWLGGGEADCPAAPEPAWLACSPFSLQAPGDTRKVGSPRTVRGRPSLGQPVDPLRAVRASPGHRPFR